MLVSNGEFNARMAWLFVVSNVDDYLSVGPHDIVTSFLEHLRSIWKTTDPVFLTPGMEFSFLGITLELTTVGLLLHQKTYTVQGSLPRGTEPQQESQSTLTKMLNHHLT